MTDQAMQAAAGGSSAAGLFLARKFKCEFDSAGNVYHASQR